MISVKNGVRQGGVSSGIFFAIYIDNLLSLLRKAKIGCHINGIFYGAMVFADDIFLLSPSRNGLQVMVNLCHEFVSRKTSSLELMSILESQKRNAFSSARDR